MGVRVAAAAAGNVPGQRTAVLRRGRSGCRASGGGSSQYAGGGRTGALRKTPVRCFTHRGRMRWGWRGRGRPHAVPRPFAKPLTGPRARLRVAQHAHVEVGVAQPGGRVLQALHGAEHDLCVQVVRDRGHVLALDRQLLVEERQVELQLAVPCRAALPLLQSGGDALCSTAMSASARSCNASHCCPENRTALLRMHDLTSCLSTPVSPALLKALWVGMANGHHAAASDHTPLLPWLCSTAHTGTARLYYMRVTHAGPARAPVMMTPSPY